MTETPKKNVEASKLATDMVKLIDGHKREDAMAALTCATGRTMAAIGIPTAAVGECMALFVEQVLDHHAKYIEEVNAR